MKRVELFTRGLEQRELCLLLPERVDEDPDRYAEKGQDAKEHRGPHVEGESRHDTALER